jgi:hypothetical protein
MLCASWHSAISTTWNRQPQAPLEAKLKKAAAGGDTTQVSIALQMVLMVDQVEYRAK